MSLSLISLSAWSQPTNIAPLATITANGGGAAGCQTGPCSTLNDLNLGTCGSQQMWINTGGTPTTTLGVDWIQWDFPTVRTFDTLVIHHAQTNARFLGGATVQYWDGANWVTHSSFNNLPQQCINRVGIGVLAAQRFRITGFIPQASGVGQLSNQNFREIEILEASTASDDAAVLKVDSPTVFCAGVQNVLVTIANFGINQIDSVDVDWEVNGVAQPTFRYFGLLDTITGANPWFAQVTLGTFNFPSGNSTVKAWTTNPNGVADTANFNDTTRRTVQTAAPPPAAVVPSVTLTTATGVVGTATGIDYVVVPFGNPATSGTPVASVNSPFTMTGLTPSTTYDLYVRKNCGGTNVSIWVGPTTFNTAYAVPYIEDFETFNPGIQSNPFPRGWVSSHNATTIPRWESEDANNGNDENTFGTGPLWDHTFFGGPTNGMYMLMETSGGTAGDSVDFVSPPILIDSILTTVELGYHYFMFGPTIDRLSVLVDTNGVQNRLATYTGQTPTLQTDPWNFDSRFLNGYNGKSVQIIFRGYNGTFSGDLAIDDITIDPVLPIDAGVTDVISPSGALCPGTLTPVIEVRNFGSTTLNSVKVYWNVNGVLDSLTYTGTVAPGARFPVTLGNLNISAGQIYNIAFYTGDVNGQADQFAGNNTLILGGLRTGLNGTVTLDPALPASATNFTTFSSLQGVVNSFGVCGNAVVNVANGVYNEYLELTRVPGLNVNNTLTIDGGDSSLTILSHDASTNLATVTLNGVDYVTIRNMTIQATNSSQGVSVLMTGGTDYNTISNCVLRVSTSSTSTLVTNVTASGSTTSPTFTPTPPTNYNTIANNRIIGGYYGVRFYGDFNTINSVGNRILNNDMDSVWYFGAYVYYQDSAEVIGNDINLLQRANINGDAIYMYTNNNGKINANNVVCDDWGIYWSNTNTLLRPLNRPNEMINNMVSSSSDYGAYIYSIDSLNFWFNSIQTFGTSAPALFFTHIVGSYEMDNIDFRNNILSSSSTAALDMNAMTDTIFVKCDNNLYNTTTGTVLVDINGATYSDLPSWITASPLLNANSLEGDPQFTSPTDLHIVGAFVNDSGDASVPITVDIDGDVRPRPAAASVDIGADEFDPPTCPPPSNQSITALGSDSVVLLWNTVIVGNPIEVEWMPCGTPQGSGTVNTVIGNSDTLRNLSAASCYQFYIREICGRGDTSVWIGPLSFNTNIQAPRGVNCTVGAPSVILTDEFDAVGGWTGNVGTGTTAGQWNFGHSGGTGSANTGPSGGAHSGTNYVYMEGSGGTPPATMVSPAIDLTGASGEAELSFWLHMTGTEIGNLTLGVSNTTAAGPFTNVFSWNGQLQPTMASPFQNVGVDLTSYIGQTIYLQFQYTGWVCCASDVAIDLLEVSTCVSCPLPDSLTSTNVGLSTADLDWRENGAATQWQVSYGPAPTAAGAGTSLIVNTLPTTNLTGLAPSTTYDWYVRAICGPADTSIWSTGETFNTANGIPFIEDFETFTPGILGGPFPRGWTATGGTTVPRWESEDANNGLNENSSNTGPLWDHTFFGGPTNGMYMYMETSGGTTGDSVDLISPPIFVGNNNSFELKYHYFMFGATMNQLKVLVDTNGVENLITTISGQQQTVQTAPWDTAVHVLSGYAGKSVSIIFRGFNGSSFTADIAIDDVELSVPTPIDGGVTSFRGLASDCGLGNDTVEVVIQNFGSQSISNFPVEYTLNGGTPVVETFTGTIGAGQSATYSFTTPVNLSAVGTYTIVARTNIPSDGNTSNDSRTITVDNIPIVNAATAWYVEDFENGSGGWTSGGANSTWELGAPAGLIINSAANGTQAWVTNLTGNHNDNEDSWVMSPCMDFSNMANPAIGVNIWYHIESYWDAAIFEASSDGGATWTRVGLQGDTINWYNDTSDVLVSNAIYPSGDAWVGDGTQGLPGSGGWIRAEHDLFGLANQPNVRLRFRFVSDVAVNAEGFAFDSVMIYNNSVVGIEDRASNAPVFSISPNPSTGLFNLSVESEKAANMRLTVRDIDGKLVREEMISVNGRLNKAMDLTDLAKGVYFMQLQNNDEIKVEKLIIQ